MDTIKQQKVLILGDVHGEWEKLFSLINRYDIKDCYLICVGDLGIGFANSHSKEIRTLEIANTFFTVRNINFLSIRGNHDNPAFFKKEIKSFSNIRLIPDYHTEIINDEKFLFVGGAVSIDRTHRKEGISYWSDEGFVLKPELVEKCDVLITHSVPSWNGPNNKSGIESWCSKDPTLWEECMAERFGHDKLIELCKPKRHYAGHMHISSTVAMNGCISKILNELEIIQIFQ